MRSRYGGGVAAVRRAGNLKSEQNWRFFNFIRLRAKHP
jgi:hypothetical protein